MLKKEGKIDDDFIKKNMSWQHTSGFSVHNGTRLSRDGEAGREALAQYIIQNQFAVKKITYNEGTVTVIYKSKMPHSKFKGGKKNFQVFSQKRSLPL